MRLVSAGLTEQNVPGVWTLMLTWAPPKTETLIAPVSLAAPVIDRSKKLGVAMTSSVTRITGDVQPTGAV